MKDVDWTGLALYMVFGMVLSASGHEVTDVTYWCLFAVLICVDIRSNGLGYSKGLTDGSNTVKQIWGIK